MLKNCYWKNRSFYLTRALLIALLLNLSCSDDKDFETGGQNPDTGEVPEETLYLPLIEISSSGQIVDEPKVRSTM